MAPISRCDARHLLALLIELIRNLGNRQVRFHFRQQTRHGHIENRAQDPAQDDDGDENQRRYRHFVVKASARVKDQDDQYEDAEVDMRLHPLLDRAERRAIPALANPEERQQETEKKARSPVNQPHARAAVRILALRIPDERRSRGDQQNEEDAAPEDAGTGYGQGGLLCCERSEIRDKRSEILTLAVLIVDLLSLISALVSDPQSLISASGDWSAETRDQRSGIAAAFLISDLLSLISDSPLPSRNHQFLKRRPILLRRQTNRGARRATAHARRAAFDFAAEIALYGHGLLDLIVSFLPKSEATHEKIVFFGSL